MVCCLRARRRRQADDASRAMLPEERPGTVIGVVAAAGSLFVRISSAAGEPVRSTSMTGEDLLVTIPPDLEAQILRYYHVEKWLIGTIARHLHVHHNTVARVLAQAGLPRIGRPTR